MRLIPPGFAEVEMAVIILAFVVVLGLLVSWIIGEAKNVRALRIPGMIAAVLIAPLAFEVGKVVGHGRAYLTARSATGDLLKAIGRAVERADTDDVLRETQRLHAISAGHDKQAGSFFLFDMYAAKERLN